MQLKKIDSYDPNSSTNFKFINTEKINFDISQIRISYMNEEEKIALIQLIRNDSDTCNKSKHTIQTSDELLVYTKTYQDIVRPCNTLWSSPI